MTATAEPDEDDSPEDEDVPIDLILCAGCRFPDVVIPPEPEPTP